jgi:glycosyltransferase involved in cell wall biosynthesis
MIKNPIVSVLTTVYNREKYLAACIESVLASTFQNWELIIVDDQSKDNSVAIAQMYAAQEMRIKFYLNEKNLGDYPNRNQAASYAKGKYLKFLDADDLIYPHGLEMMVQTMEAHPECALGISQEVAEDYKPYPFVMTPRETFQREFLKRGVLGLGPTATIMRRDIFETFGGFTGTRFIGDTEMWYQLAFQYPILKIVPGLTFWRQHEDQEITKGQDSFFYLENAYKHQVLTLKHPDLPVEDIEREMALKKVQKRFSRNLLTLIRQGRFKTADRIRKNCKISWLMVFKSV